MTLKRGIRIFVVNLVVLGLAAELIALGIFYFQHGWLFYLDPYRTHYEPIPETRQGALSAMGLHPYLGPTHRPAIPFDIPEALRQGDRPVVSTNNLGFVSPFDYPYARRNERQFVIGLFGGSVGLWFCQVATDRLLEDLRRDPFFAAREIVPLCASHEGYKQPQQLQLLTYLLELGQQFDLVINIDGFNEVALGSINDAHGWDVSMPSFMHLDPLINVIDQGTLTPEKLATLAAIERDKERLNWLAERINGARLASVDVALEQYYVIVLRRYQAGVVRFGELASGPGGTEVVRVTPRTRPVDSDVFETIAAAWMRASGLMRDLLADRGVSYIHVLQPNQYYGGRRFSPEEAAVAINPGSPFKAGAEQGYPALIRAAQSHADGHHQVFDATHIFDGESSPVYMDDCCHYTLRGNTLLADFVAAAVLQSDGPWRR